ncbi:hypothetical protein RhiirA4_415657 [Rhizophagus irregularis]|uniref:Uncharacterized protein n=1 Tax=Rhizophagus irregularis TaxID=588596 RepID=A0A2I1G0R0_9GLOM|nr:hypothetical protein RhiirA4_415657 [Rhizophagus irregularis]
MPKPNYKHLKHSKEQQKELLSLPYSKFIDKCLSQNDAHSFLKEHNLMPGKNRESKWRVRYSNNAKNKRLLQCIHGSNIQRTRKMNTFVGCLAFARITELGNEGIHIFGYLNHLEDCQRQNPSCVNNGVENYEHEAKTNKEHKANEIINKNNNKYMAKNGKESKINKFKNNNELIRFENALKSWEVTNNNEEFIPWDIFYQYYYY